VSKKELKKNNRRVGIRRCPGCKKIEILTIREEGWGLLFWSRE